MKNHFQGFLMKRLLYIVFWFTIAAQKADACAPNIHKNELEQVWTDKTLLKKFLTDIKNPQTFSSAYDLFSILNEISELARAHNIDSTSLLQKIKQLT